MFVYAVNGCEVVLMWRIILFQGTTYVYDSFLKPYVSKHETEIDRNLLELRTRAGDLAYMYCHMAASYGQTRIFEVLQYVASQSTPRPRARQVHLLSFWLALYFHETVL